MGYALTSGVKTDQLKVFAAQSLFELCDALGLLQIDPAEVEPIDTVILQRLDGAPKQKIMCVGFAPQGA